MEGNGLYNGYRLNKWAPTVSHIMFADVMLFGTINKNTINSISAILQQYYCVSGQVVNHSKSPIYFSKKVDEDQQEEIFTILGVSKMNKDDKYLGVKILQQGNSVSNFEFLIDKFDNKLSGWKRKSISHAGRHTLIISVLALIPVFYMATSIIPKTILNKLTQIIRDFWWDILGNQGGCIFLNENGLICQRRNVDLESGFFPI
ncbi:uncharacterized protein LOC113279504 [Papaver somniferum]|uniref:uncharacterized protein LOC113279504 n=1 Tax=Papaver somniferum TaxID=3469 RepID=UPI000E6F4896|nr:uncharacterized protein LOC113279504 [Papaver somniferum]